MFRNIDISREVADVLLDALKNLRITFFGLREHVFFFSGSYLEEIIKLSARPVSAVKELAISGYAVKDKWVFPPPGWTSLRESQIEVIDVLFDGSVNPLSYEFLDSLPISLRRLSVFSTYFRLDNLIRMIMLL